MKKVLTIATLIFIVILTSCRGKDQYLIGVWKEVPFVSPDSTNENSTWNFYAGDALVIKTIYKSDKKNDSISYTYSLSGSKLTIYGDWDYQPAVGDIRGEYWVDVLKKKELKITKRKHPDGEKGGAYIRKEFVK